MTDRSNRLLGLGVFCALFAAAPAGAEPPAAGPNAPNEPEHGASRAAEAKGRTAEAKADKAEAKAERAEARSDKAEVGAERAEAKAERSPIQAENTEGASAAHPGRALGHFKSDVRMLHEQVESGSIDATELKTRLGKLAESRDQRRLAHREALKTRWGAVLASSSVRDEVRAHERRMAFLNRALVVAQLEMKAAEKEKTIERVEKLIERENERHEKAMNRLASASDTKGATR